MLFKQQEQSILFPVTPSTDLRYHRAAIIRPALLSAAFSGPKFLRFGFCPPREKFSFGTFKLIQRDSSQRRLDFIQTLASNLGCVLCASTGLKSFLYLHLSPQTSWPCSLYLVSVLKSSTALIRLFSSFVLVAICSCCRNIFINIIPRHAFHGSN